MRQMQKLGVSLTLFFQINTGWSQTTQIDPARFLAGACISCHTMDTSARSAIPSLVGVPASSILSDLLNYANDKRDGLLMPQIAKGYTREQMEMIADFFSSQEAL
ncbi:MAG TPA: cytochrome C [Advenella sp.]|nr:cytochrome C [Advenella sp.]